MTHEAAWLREALGVDCVLLNSSRKAPPLGVTAITLGQLLLFGVALIAQVVWFVFLLEDDDVVDVAVEGGAAFSCSSSLSEMVITSGTGLG